MQKYLFIIAVFSSLSGLAQNQNSHHESLSPEKFFSDLELYGGPALSTVRGWKLEGTNIDLSTKTGYSFGIGVSHRINSSIKIKGNLFFERKGVISKFPAEYFDEETQTFKIAEVTNNYGLSYYTIAVSPCYGINRFEVSIGPYASYLQKGDISSTYSFSSGKPWVHELKSFYKDFDFGISAFAGYRIPIKSNLDFKIQVSHTYGLVDIVKESTEGWSTKTNNTSLLVGICLRQL